MKSIRINYWLALLALTILLFTACDPARNKATLGNSKDTTSMNHGGPVKVDSPKQDSAAMDSTNAKHKRNIDPAGNN